MPKFCFAFELKTTYFLSIESQLDGADLYIKFNKWLHQNTDSSRHLRFSLFCVNIKK